jgi:hypothetical protein
MVSTFSACECLSVFMCVYVMARPKNGPLGPAYTIAARWREAGLEAGGPGPGEYQQLKYMWASQQLITWPAVHDDQVVIYWQGTCMVAAGQQR